MLKKQSRICVLAKYEKNAVCYLVIRNEFYLLLIGLTAQKQSYRRVATLFGELTGKVGEFHSFGHGGQRHFQMSNFDHYVNVVW